MVFCINWLPIEEAAYSSLSNQDHSKKVRVGNDQVKAQSEKDSHSKNRDGKKKLTIRYLYHENIS